MNYQLEDILSSLKLPAPSQKIYIELLKNGSATPRILSERLMITRPSVYDHLEKLQKLGLIIEKEIDNKSYFAVDDTKHIETMLDNTIEELSEKKKSFTEMLPTLLQNTEGSAPVIKFYEGKLGLTHLLNDVLHSDEKELFTMWPYEEMLQVLGEEQLVRFNKRRLQEKITVQALWPHTAKMNKKHIWSNEDTLTERRIAKKDITWDMGYTIYGNKVSFISSQKEVFGFIVSSHDFAQLMKVQFDALWKISSLK